MSTRDDYVKKMHALLDKLNAEADELAERADQVRAGVREEYHAQLAQLRTRQAQARDRLASLRDAGEDAWEDLKAGVEMAKEAIGEAIESAKARLDK
ncbi:MAG TPA: coiled coil domain-containing protein [Thiobacillaceae bacterium]|nr:coiled coil domain-containing protein [Thiobacillaceae bacterium]